MAVFQSGHTGAELEHLLDKDHLLEPLLVGTAVTSTVAESGSYYNGFVFDLGTENIDGLYLFTYSLSMILVPVVGLPDGAKCKVVGAVDTGDNTQGYLNKILTYVLSTDSGHRYLSIYQRENKIPAGYTASLYKIKLYTGDN